MKNYKKILLMMALVASVGLTACGNNTETKDAPKQETTTEQEAVSDQQASFQEMKGDELDKIIEDKEKKEEYLILDVRGDEDYQAGHVKWAVHMNVDELEGRLGELEGFKDKNVVTICNTGKKSAKAAEILVANGFKNVFNAEGVKDFSYTTITKVENILGPQLEKLAQEASDNVFIIDVRDAKDFEKGHLKNAVNIPADEIDAKIAEVPKDKEIYTYCYSGNKSMAVAQKLSDAGYEKVTSALDGTKEFEYTLEQ